MTLENVGKDYCKYCDVDINGKFLPINKTIEDMLARLEEFQTMVSFVKQDGTDSNDILTSLPNYKSDLDEMFNKIDTVESLITHMKNNLDKLEDDIEKAEIEFGYNDPKKKVASIFTPLFRKNNEKRQPTPNLKLFKVENYFEQQNRNTRNFSKVYGLARPT